MDLITPAIGQMFWASLVFIILLILLGKFAWKPMLNSIKTREAGIQDAIELAEKTRGEMEKLQTSNENLLKEARLERETLMKEGRTMRDEIIAQAKTKATEEAEKVRKNALESIANEKQAAIADLKNQVATLSIDIAEKILKEKLSSDEKQQQLVDSLTDDINLN